MHTKTPPTIVQPAAGARIRFADIAMQFKVGSQQTPGGVAVHEWTLAPGTLGSPPHLHEREDEIFYVLTGTVTVMQDDEVFTAGAGSYVVLPRGHVHAFWNAGAEPLRLLVIMTPGQLEGFFEAVQEQDPPLPPDFEKVGQVADEYGMTLDFARTPELLMTHGLRTSIAPSPDGGNVNG